MNISSLIKTAWHITLRQPALWGLTLLMFVTFFPALTLSGTFAGGAALVALPWPFGTRPEWLAAWLALPLWAWLVFALITLLVIVLCTTLSWVLQAALMRGAALAAERGPTTGGVHPHRVRVREALALGPQRLRNIALLSGVYGLLVALLAVAPSVVHLLLAGPLQIVGLAALQTFQTFVAPFNTIVSVAFLLITMSVALDDLRPRAAMREAWRVFRAGWWGFVLVVVLTLAASVALVLVLTPVLLVPLIVIAYDPNVALWLGLALCGLGGPVGVWLMLFIGVYTQVLYTLVYRATQQLLAPRSVP